MSLNIQSNVTMPQNKMAFKVQNGRNVTFSGYVDSKFKLHLRKLALVQAEMWTKVANNDGVPVDKSRLIMLKELTEKIISNLDEKMKQNFHPDTVLEKVGDFYFKFSNKKIGTEISASEIHDISGFENEVRDALYYGILKLPKGILNHSECPCSAYKLKDQKKAVNKLYNPFCQGYQRPYLNGIQKYLKYWLKTSEKFGDKNAGSFIDSLLFDKYIEKKRPKIRWLWSEKRILKTGAMLEGLAPEFNTRLDRCDIGQRYIRAQQTNIPKNNNVFKEIYGNADI